MSDDSVRGEWVKNSRNAKDEASLTPVELAVSWVFFGSISAHILKESWVGGIQYAADVAGLVIYCNRQRCTCEWVKNSKHVTDATRTWGLAASSSAYLLHFAFIGLQIPA